MPLKRPKAPAAKPRVTDWRFGAELLAQGYSLSETAARLQCPDEELALKRDADAEFQEWLTAERRALELNEPVGKRIARLAATALSTIGHEIRRDNLRVVLWLADRLKLVTPEPRNASPQDDLRALLDGLNDDDLNEFKRLGKEEDASERP